jgi:predicted DNA-binding transcriptional regulator AlpA
MIYPIQPHTLAVKEYQGQPVVTLKDVDELHQRPEGTARKRFNDNRERFIEGEDFFVRNSDEAKNEFGIVAPNGLTLLTEMGYLMLIKSFTDDLAWHIQRQLVKCYFRPPPPVLPAPAPPVAALEKFTCSVREWAKMIGVSVPKAYEMMHIEDFPVVFLGRRRVVLLTQAKEWMIENASNAMKTKGGTIYGRI